MYIRFKLHLSCASQPTYSTSPKILPSIQVNCTFKRCSPLNSLIMRFDICSSFILTHPSNSSLLPESEFAYSLYPLSICVTKQQAHTLWKVTNQQCFLHVYTGQQNSYHCSALLWLCYNLWFCIFPILKFKEPLVLSIWRSLFDKINNWWILWKINLERIVVQGGVLPSMLWVGENHGDVWKLVLWFFENCWPKDSHTQSHLDIKFSQFSYLISWPVFMIFIMKRLVLQFDSCASFNKMMSTWVPVIRTWIPSFSLQTGYPHNTENCTSSERLVYAPLIGSSFALD